ncbi:MAG: sensor histidine kinase [Desulfobulbaceae bacterium]|nr:sensor histidine kinase [Desulfobulbaceae bacterium]
MNKLKDPQIQLQRCQQAAWQHLLDLSATRRVCAAFCSSWVTLFVLVFLTVLATTRATAYAQTPHSSGTGPDKRVVVLYSVPHDFPATELVEKGIREVFSQNSLSNVQLFSEYMDLSRFRDAEQRNALAGLLKERYEQGAIDLVILVDVPAIFFLLEHESIFIDIPLVMCLMPEIMREQIARSRLGQQACGVLVSQNLYDKYVRASLALFPHTRQVAMISGAFEADQIHLTMLRRAIERERGGRQVLELSGLTPEEVQQQSARLSRNTPIFYSTLFVDPAGRSYIPRRVLDTLVTSTSAPVFGMYESYFGRGIIGGPMVAMQQHGRLAAERAVAVLQGQAPEQLGFTDGNEAEMVAYDWRQLHRFQIREGLLVPDASIEFRQATLWEQYKYVFIALAALMVLQSALILGLVFNLRWRKKGEQQLLEQQVELETLAGRLIAGREEEMQRLSRAFHDDLMQRLAAVSIKAGTLERQAADGHAAMLEPIQGIKQQLVSLTEDIHTISRELHPSILKDLGLEKALQSLCANFTERSGIKVELYDHGLSSTVDCQEQILCIYRVVQEALHNIAKHAGASHVDVFVENRLDKLVLTIEDDGAGFDIITAPRSPGIGLAIMRERARLVGGSFTIHSEPGQGTVVDLVIPKKSKTHGENQDSSR